MIKTGKNVVWELGLVYLLTNILQFLYPFTLEIFLGEVAIVFNIVDLSLQCYFGLAKAMGLLDSGENIICKIAHIIASPMYDVALIVYAKIDPLFEVGCTFMPPNMPISPRVGKVSQCLRELVSFIENN